MSTRADDRRWHTLLAAREASPSTTVTVIEPAHRWLGVDLRSLWQHRELLYFLVWRDVKVRYKQTVIGAGWAVLQPLLTLVILSTVFGGFARIPSDGVPYPIFAYTALLPWVFFAEALTRSGASLVRNANVITKVYFPRLLVPLAALIAPAVDFLLSFGLLMGLMLWYGITPSWTIVLLPVLLLIALVTALAVALWVAPLNTHYRDVAHTLPFLVQAWMFASPVAYPVSLVSEQWRLLYGLNPMVGVIEGFRWALLGHARPDLRLMVVSAVVTVALMAGGLLYFRRLERTVADIV